MGTNSKFCAQVLKLPGDINSNNFQRIGQGIWQHNGNSCITQSVTAGRTVGQLVFAGMYDAAINPYNGNTKAKKVQPVQ